MSIFRPRRANGQFKAKLVGKQPPRSVVDSRIKAMIEAHADHADHVSDHYIELEDMYEAMLAERAEEHGEKVESHPERVEADFKLVIASAGLAEMEKDISDSLHAIEALETMPRRKAAKLLKTLDRLEGRK